MKFKNLKVFSKAKGKSKFYAFALATILSITPLTGCSNKVSKEDHEKVVSELADLEEELNDKIAKLENENADLKQQLNNSNEEKEELNNKITQLEKENENLVQRFDDANREKIDLNSKIDELEIINTDLEQQLNNLDVSEEEPILEPIDEEMSSDEKVAIEERKANLYKYTYISSGNNSNDIIINGKRYLYVINENVKAIGYIDPDTFEEVIPLGKYSYVSSGNNSNDITINDKRYLFVIDKNEKAILETYKDQILLALDFVNQSNQIESIDTNSFTYKIKV